MTQRERNYARVYARLSAAYSGGGSFGCDWVTISEGLRDAADRLHVARPVYRLGPSRPRVTG